MTSATLLFFALALVAVASAVGMLLSRNTVYAALLLIVTARKNNGQVTLTANLRAPVVVNRKERVARQYVMPNSTYEIRHVL